MGLDVEGAYGLDLVAEEVDADRTFGVAGEDIDYAAGPVLDITEERGAERKRLEQIAWSKESPLAVAMVESGDFGG